VDTNLCPTCLLSKQSEWFWDKHQTMADGHIWCVSSRTRKIDEMTTAIVSKYRAEVKSKYGNRKRHRQ